MSATQTIAIAASASQGERACSWTSATHAAISSIRLIRMIRFHPLVLSTVPDASILA